MNIANNSYFSVNALLIHRSPIFKHFNMDKYDAKRSTFIFKRKFKNGTSESWKLEGTKD